MIKLCACIYIYLELFGYIWMKHPIHICRGLLGAWSLGFWNSRRRASQFAITHELVEATVNSKMCAMASSSHTMRSPTATAKAHASWEQSQRVEGQVQIQQVAGIPRRWPVVPTTPQTWPHDKPHKPHKPHKPTLKIQKFRCFLNHRSYPSLSTSQVNY